MRPLVQCAVYFSLSAFLYCIIEDYDTNYLKAEKDHLPNLTCPDFINDTVKILQEKGVSAVCSILQSSTCNTELPRLKFYSLPISV